MNNSLIITIVFLFAGSAFSEKILEKYPNGKTKVTYNTNANGKKHGLYAEYHEKGTLKVKANYVDGVLHSSYSEMDEKGSIVIDSFYDNGLLVYPKSKKLLKTQLKEINSSKPDKEKTEFTSKSHASAINLLNSYRCIVGLGFDVELKDSYCKTAQAGAELCNKIGRLDHTPKNPGLPEDVYKAGYEGTSQSNLSMGRAMESTPMGYMDDSDSSNIDRVGHRRWCINPSMQYTGFGTSGRFSAMYAFDNSRANVPDYDYISFPARGYQPLKYFAPHYAWSVSLNPAKFSAPDKGSVKAEIFKLGRTDKLPLVTEGEEPLKLNYFNINNSGFGVSYCIIFRPESIKMSNSAKYWVKISGLKDKDGKETTVEYLVEFANI